MEGRTPLRGSGKAAASESHHSPKKAGGAGHNSAAIADSTATSSPNAENASTRGKSHASDPAPSAATTSLIQARPPATRKTSVNGRGNGNHRGSLIRDVARASSSSGGGGVVVPASLTSAENAPHTGPTRPTLPSTATSPSPSHDSSAAKALAKAHSAGAPEPSAAATAAAAVAAPPERAGGGAPSRATPAAPAREAPQGSSETSLTKKTMAAAAAPAIAPEHHQQVTLTEENDAESGEPPLVPLSPRAIAIVTRIQDFMQRCHYYRCLAECAEAKEPFDTSAFPAEAAEWATPTEEEQIMYEVLLSLYMTPIGPLFMSQPEISLSNRSCVLATPDFAKGEVVAGFTICAPYSPGTIGRSHFAARKSISSSSSSGDDVAAAAVAAVTAARAGGKPANASFSLAEAKARKSAAVERDVRNFCVMKMLSFRLRKELVKGVISDQCVLTKLSCDQVLKVHDVLKDDYLEKVIIITTFQQRGNLSTVAGKLDDDPDRFRRISADVAVGLSTLHANKVYHHNLKPENVLETADGGFCVADAGFYRLFISQCPEALIFNGELACLPPEVFDESGPYYSAEPNYGVDSSPVIARGESTQVDGERALDTSPSAPQALNHQRHSIATAGGDEGVTTPSTITTVTSNSSALSSSSQSRFFLHHQQQQQQMSCATKADVWGYGVLLYRLAYGRDPLEIAMRHVEEVRALVKHHEPVYPPKPMWPFHADLVDVMKACLQKNPSNRPDMAELLRMPYFTDMGVVGGMKNASVPASVASPVLAVGSGGVGAAARPASSNGVARSQNRNGYTVDAMLGTGRLSETMLVHQRRNTHKRFAFKVLKKPVLKRALAAHDNVKALTAVKEARTHALMRCLAICRKMSHPNLVSYVDIVDNKKGRCFLVQEYMKNGPLLAMPMLTSQVSRVPDMEQLLSDVLLALIYLHDNEIAHLSLTPSNIFYDDTTDRFRVADFGPLFLTMDELVDAERKGKPIYALPARIFAGNPPNRYHVDTFFVGLLAASAVPALFSSVWQQVRHQAHAASSPRGKDRSGGGGSGPPRFGKGLDIEEILRAVRTASKPLPRLLVDFIQVALCRGMTARQLIEHPYFGGKHASRDIPVERVEVSPEEIVAAVRAKPQNRELQQSLVDLHGPDAFAESQVLSSVMAECETSLSAVDKSLVVHFTGDKLCCGQCNAEVKVALYRCSTCPDVIRCGKCAVNDAHHVGHTLVPQVIWNLERGPGSTGKAQLCHPSSIQDVHALETLEMGANFPVGALSGHTANQRHLERSMARSIVGNTVGAGQRPFFGGPDLGSMTYLPDTECSVSAIGVRSSTSIKPMNIASNFAFSGQQTPRETSVSGTGDSMATGTPSNSFRGGSSSGTTAVGSGGLLNHSSHATGGGGNLRNLLAQNPPPAPPALGQKSNLLGNASKKIALPKAEDLDDLPWEEELRLCREGELTELLLFNYGFTQVPTEVFTPPPLHVVFLDLSQNNLTSLPHELSFLAHLRKLIVSNNKLEEMPDSLGNLSELESIDASHNLLVDLPMTFIYLTKLQSCAMDYNCFKEIPQSIVDILAPNQAAAGVEQLAEGGSDHEGSATTATAAAKEAKTKKQRSKETKKERRKPSTGDARERAGPHSDNSTGSCSDDEDEEDYGDDDEEEEGSTPNLRVLYLAANDGIVSLPDIEKLRRFSDLKIALDNEPSLYRFYMENDWENQLPNVSITWNKIYPDEIIPNLYCGSLRSAQTQIVYKKLQIGYVLTVGRGLTPVPPEGGKHKTIVVDDIPGADILTSVSEAIEFIEESQRAGSGCLVHCFAGLSRSATTVIAYLMMKKRMRLDEAYLVTKRGRPAILPNNGFFQQLIELDKQLYPKAERPLDLASLDRPPVDEPTPAKGK